MLGNVWFIAFLGMVIIVCHIWNFRLLYDSVWCWCLVKALWTWIVFVCVFLHSINYVHHIDRLRIEMVIFLMTGDKKLWELYIYFFSVPLVTHFTRSWTFPKLPLQMMWRRLTGDWHLCIILTKIQTIPKQLKRWGWLSASCDYFKCT